MFTHEIKARFPEGLDSFKLAALVIKYEALLKDALPGMDSRQAYETRLALHLATHHKGCPECALPNNA